MWPHFAPVGKLDEKDIDWTPKGVDLNRWRQCTARVDSELLAALDRPRFNAWKRNVEKACNRQVEIDDDEDVSPVSTGEENQGFSPELNAWKEKVDRATSCLVQTNNDEDFLPANTDEEDQGIRPKDPNLGPFTHLPRIPFTEDYWTRLWDASIRGTSKWGYQMEQFRSFGKERCRNCRFCMWGKRRLNLLANESKIRENTEKEAQRKPEEEPKVGEVKEYLFDEMTEEQIGSVLWTAEAIAKWRRRQTAKALQRKAKYGCVGHPGKPTGRYQKFSCCGRDINTPGCHQFPDHDIVENVKAWEHAWYLHEAPENPVDYRYAIALDCEMGITDLGEQELIRITAIDYFTGEILINTLVFPKVRMWHLNVRYSGVTWQQLYAARDARQALHGRDEARNLLFRYLGPKTVLVMQGGRSDMLALRIIHHHILDTLSFQQASLKWAAEHYLERKIQQGRGHDSLEDALACRDIANYFIETLPFDHIYQRNYGQMTRYELNQSREKPREDGVVIPDWVPPPSKNRVPFLKSYPSYDSWALLQIQWDEDDKEEARKHLEGLKDGFGWMERRKDGDFSDAGSNSDPLSEKNGSEW